MENLNCKQGDVAIVVGGHYNLGKVFTCLRLVAPKEVLEEEKTVWGVYR